MGEVNLTEVVRMGRIIRETDILCDNCGKANLVVVEPGSETARQLICKKCGQYHYFVGRIWCSLTSGVSTPPSQELEERLRKELEGYTQLQPGVLEKVRRYEALARGEEKRTLRAQVEVVSLEKVNDGDTLWFERESR